MIAELLTLIQSGVLVVLLLSVAVLIVGYLFWHGRWRTVAWLFGLPLLLGGFVLTIISGWSSFNYLSVHKKMPPFLPGDTPLVAVEVPTPRAWLDHIVVGIYDLDAGIAELKALTGQQAIRSGRHPKLGTETAVLRLGDDSFLELIAPQPDAEVTGDNQDLVVGYKELLSEHKTLTPFLWSIGTNDLRWLRRQITGTGFEMTPVIENSRELPDGSALAYLGASVAVGRPGFPFFVQWQAPSVAALAPAGAACTIYKWRVWTPNDVALQRLAEVLAVQVDVGEASTQALRAVLRCDGRTVVLGGTPG